MALMQFYMTPGSCSTGIHVLLEECELLFSVQLVDLLRGGNRSDAYLHINPRGTIPALVLEDGRVLADWVDIALHLAEQYPERKLLPSDSRQRLRAVSLVDKVVNELHGEGFTRIFTTDAYRAEGAGDEIVAAGQQRVRRGLQDFDQLLAGRQWLFDDFGIADAALFYCEFWANHIDLDLPENCKRHFSSSLQRPAVRQVLFEEGYGALYC